jgi:hypothetical protein
MLMLVALPGKERDLKELDAIFTASCWLGRKVTPAIFAFSILELQAI